MKAVLCPVCNGSGRVSVLTSTDMAGEPCHGCAEWGSRGWIIIPEALSIFPVWEIPMTTVPTNYITSVWPPNGDWHYQDV